MPALTVQAAASSPPVPRLHAGTVIHLCGLFLLSRLLVLAAAALSHLAIVPGPFPPTGQTWIDRFTMWDASWYLGIAGEGYFYDPHGQSSVGFYPLYPLMMRAAGGLGIDPVLAGYGISHAALLGSCFLLWKLAALETRSESIAERSVLFLLFCPGAMWFGMIYTESLSLLTSLACLLCARRNRWLAAGLWGLAAALTRTPGLLLAGFLFLEGIQQWRERRRLVAEQTPVPAVDARWPAALGGLRRKLAAIPWPARAACAVAGPVLGHVSYLVFLQVRFGDWRAQQKTVAAGWNHGHGWILSWGALAAQWQTIDPYTLAISLPLLAITLSLAMIGFFSLKRIGYGALVIALCFLYVSATSGDALTRYLSTAAPVYIVLAQLANRSRLLEITALVFSVGIMVLITVFAINGYHVN